MFAGVLDAIDKGFMSTDQLPEIMAACLGKLLEALKQEVNGTSRGCAAECLKDVLHTCYVSGTEGPDGYRSGALCAPDVDISAGIMDELLALCSESLER
jgi:hypothetical protein